MKAYNFVLNLRFLITNFPILNIVILKISYFLDWWTVKSKDFFDVYIVYNVYYTSHHSTIRP